MESITRKTLLYKSGLGFYCINHVQGCSHSCRYPCYAYMIAHSHGRTKSIDEWSTPKLVSNAEELLKKELSRKRQKPESIHLCLSTDPFMTDYPEVSAMSLKLIALINAYGVRCSVLTKGMLPAELADKSRFRADNNYSICLVSLNEAFRKQWEPGATPYAERIRALNYLHENGCYTSVHIEPYPTPNIIQQDLEIMLKSVAFVDHIFFSGWNYNAIVKQFPNYQTFYREQASIVKRFCIQHAIACETGF